MHMHIKVHWQGMRLVCQASWGCGTHVLIMQSIYMMAADDETCRLSAFGEVIEQAERQYGLANRSLTEYR